MEKQFGQRVRFVREMRGMTQAALAQTSEIDAAVISHIESGNRLPGVANIKALCRGLVVSSDYLLGLSERIAP